MRRLAPVALAVIACRPAPPEPLPTMEKRARPLEKPVAGTPARCPRAPYEAAWLHDRLVVCARATSDGLPYTCTFDDTVFQEADLPWSDAVERRVDVSADAIAEWTDDGVVTLRDRASGEPVQTVVVRMQTSDVTLSVAEGPPVTLRGWGAGACDFLLHFGGDG